MVKGTVKFFNSEEDYGFIEVEEKDEDIYLHSSEIPRGESVYDGDELEFEIEQEERGPKAVNVKKL